MKTQKCMDDAGGFDGDDNTLLRDELAVGAWLCCIALLCDSFPFFFTSSLSLQARRDLGIVVLPSVVVNNIIEMGEHRTLPLLPLGTRLRSIPLKAPWNRNTP